MVIRGIISAEGCVADLKVVSGGHPMLEVVAAAAFNRQSFKPARRNGNRAGLLHAHHELRPEAP